jgi:hypothetical protein
MLAPIKFGTVHIWIVGVGGGVLVGDGVIVLTTGVLAGAPFWDWPLRIGMI